MSVTDARITNASDASLAMAHARELFASGRALDAIAYATAQNRVFEDFALERQLVQWRHQAFSSLAGSAARSDWPPRYPDCFPDPQRLPEIERDQLTTETLAAGILHHGSVLVRGLIRPEQAQNMVHGIDQAFNDAERQRAASAGTTVSTPWYSHFPSNGNSLSDTRPWVEDSGGVWLADSPRMMFEFAELLDDIQILPLIARYFGERPTLSIFKSTLRRIPKTQRTTGWHQDGAFLGAGIRSVNLWLCMSHCGVYASGLDLVQKRLNHLVQAGTHGAYFDWSVGDEMARMASGETPIATPVFRPGDALLFDEMMLHRTGIAEQMKEDRYAIEAWFFAPSSYPMQQMPLVV